MSLWRVATDIASHSHSRTTLLWFQSRLHCVEKGKPTELADNFQKQWTWFLIAVLSKNGTQYSIFVGVLIKLSICQAPNIEYVLEIPF